jgi:hypothetical protein
LRDDITEPVNRRFGKPEVRHSFVSSPIILIIKAHQNHRESPARSGPKRGPEAHWRPPPNPWIFAPHPIPIRKVLDSFGGVLTSGCLHILKSACRADYRFPFGNGCPVEGLSVRTVPPFCCFIAVIANPQSHRTPNSRCVERRRADWADGRFRAEPSHVGRSTPRFRSAYRILTEVAITPMSFTLNLRVRRLFKAPVLFRRRRAGLSLRG